MIDPNEDFLQPEYYDLITAHKGLAKDLYAIIKAKSQIVKFLKYKKCILFLNLNLINLVREGAKTKEYFPYSIDIEGKTFFVSYIFHEEPEVGTIYFDYCGPDDESCDEAWYKLCQKYTLSPVDWYCLGAYLT